MFKAISNFVVRTADLVEAEIHIFRQGVVRLAIGLLLAVVALALALAGVLTLASAIYQALKEALGQPWALAVSALLLLLFAGGVWLLSQLYLDTKDDAKP